jgi:hypothetical protein
MSDLSEYGITSPGIIIEPVGVEGQFAFAAITPASIGILWESEVNKQISNAWLQGCSQLLDVLEGQITALVPPYFSNLIAATNLVTIDGDQRSMEIMIPVMKSPRMMAFLSMVFEGNALPTMVMMMQPIIIIVSMQPFYTTNIMEKGGRTILEKQGYLSQISEGG